MANVDDIKQLYFSSQYGMDKILFSEEGTFPISARSGTFTPTTTTTSFSHDVEGKCLPVMIWSRDGVTYYPAGTGYLGANGFADPTDQTTEVTVHCNETTVTIEARNWLNTTPTIRYSVVLLGLD